MITNRISYDNRVRNPKVASSLFDNINYVDIKFSF
jgi:hypothetical protein